MNFLIASLAFVIATIWGYFILKILQLSSYKPKKIIGKIYLFNYLNNDKNLLKFTKRIIRLICLTLVLELTFLILFAIFLEKVWIFSIISIIFVVFSPFFTILSFYLILPLESFIKYNFILKAKRKLKSCPCVKIGITGSFGKTSTKNILYDILSQKYKVLKTPHSYNTPMGVCKTILDELDKSYDFFIIEMGARHTGDIEYLARMTNIDHAILTPVGKVHLETFKTLENIEDEKSKISLPLTYGFMVINARSSSNLKIYEKCEKNKFLVCQKGGFAYSENITYSSEGSSFDLVIDGAKTSVKTKLLGKSNIDNIVTASATAYLLGQELCDIVRGIKSIEQIPHRLEVIKTDKLTIIDDSYNSNFEGAKNALDVLSKFSCRRVVVTCGMVELGSMQFSFNKKFGRLIAKSCDIVIIMNKTNKEAIYKGLIESHFKEENIYFANTRKEQEELLKTILKPKDCVLFENDLPDDYK